MANDKNKGLGRGLDSLIPKNFDTSLLTEHHERVQSLNVSDVKPNPKQPRRHFDSQSLQELADSIKQHGVLLRLQIMSK